MTVAIDFLEETFAGAYRRELEQEENIWRSLPFFAASLALELAALSQVLGHVQEVAGIARWPVLCLVVVTAVLSVTALGFTIAAINPAPFQYVASELDLLRYAGTLDDGPAATTAESTLKETLARQYAIVIGHNRALNQRRSQFRSIAGLCILLGVLATFLLAGVVFWHYGAAIYIGDGHAAAGPL